MLLGYEQKLEELVVRALLARNGLTAEQVRSSVDGIGTACTIQAIYQELRKLIAQGVVIKHGRQYSLRLGWRLDLLQLFEASFEASLSREALQTMVPAAGDRVRFPFHSLERLVSFFAHVALTLTYNSTDRRYFDWVPFVWYHFVDSANEAQYLRAVTAARMKYYLISGSDTKFDQLYRTIGSTGVEAFHCGRKGLWSTSLPLDRRFVSTVGDFIIEIHFPRERVSAVREVLRGPLTEETMRKLQKLLIKRGRFALSIRNDRDAAAKIRRRFCEFLGLPLVPR